MAYMKICVSNSFHSWEEIREEIPAVVRGNLVTMPRYGTFGNTRKRNVPGDVVPIRKNDMAAAQES